MNTCLNKVLFILTLKDNSGQSVNVTFNFVSIHHAPVRTIFQHFFGVESKHTDGSYASVSGK